MAMALSTFELFCAFLTILLLCYYYLTAYFNHWRSCGVNGPKPIPFFGNFAHFFLGKTSFTNQFKEIYDTYPKEPAVGLFYGRSPILLLKDFEYIKQVLIKDFSLFPQRHQVVYEKAEPMSLHLFRIDGVRWRPLRTRLSPVFTSGKLKDMFHLLLGCSEHFERYLNEIVPKDTIVDCRELTSKFTIDVIGSCAFGIDMNALNGNSEFCKMGYKMFRIDWKTILRQRLQESLPRFYTHVGHLLNDNDVSKFMTDIIRGTIEYRKKNNIRRHDFVDILIDFEDHPEKLHPNVVTDTFLAAQMFVFFGAGFETSSNTMMHILYELALNPSIQEKVREEINEIIENNGNVLSYDCIQKMHYLDKVFKETLRMYPPLTFIARRAMKNYVFEGTTTVVPKGHLVYIPIYAIHRDPNNFPNPDVFDPERFNKENVNLRDAMCYLPFGSGPRNCIGLRFAGYQVKVGIIKMLKNYKAEVCEETLIPYLNHPQHSMILKPKEGLKLRLIKLVQ